jgi:hypothetical protein
MHAIKQLHSGENINVNVKLGDGWYSEAVFRVEGMFCILWNILSIDADDAREIDRLTFYRASIASR